MAKEIAARTKGECLPGLHKSKKRFLPFFASTSYVKSKSKKNSFPPFHPFSLFQNLPPSPKALKSLNDSKSPLVTVESPLCLSYALLDVKLKKEELRQKKSLNPEAQAILKASGLLSDHPLIDISNFSELRIRSTSSLFR